MLQKLDDDGDGRAPELGLALRIQRRKTPQHIRQDIGDLFASTPKVLLGELLLAPPGQRLPNAALLLLPPPPSPHARKHGWDHAPPLPGPQPKAPQARGAQNIIIARRNRSIRLKANRTTHQSRQERSSRALSVVSAGRAGLCNDLFPCGLCLWQSLRFKSRLCVFRMLLCQAPQFPLLAMCSLSAVRDVKCPQP